MSALKIKDAQGNWIEVPMIKGDKGDKGEQGDTYELTEQDKQDIAELVEVPESFEIHICSSSEYDSTTRIPTIANPDEKTFYLVPSEDGTSPDLFVEWAYVNNAWEMFGSASIDLSGYLTDVTVDGNSVVTDGVAEIPVASSSTFGTVKTDASLGITINSNGKLVINRSTTAQNKVGTDSARPIVPINQHESTFYGLARASGDSTQSASANAVGTYTDEAKASIQSMLGVPSVDDIPDTSIYAEKADTILETTLSRGRKANTTVGTGSIAFGSNVEASGEYSFAVGNSTVASGSNSKAEGWGAIASGSNSHSEGNGTIANGSNTHAEGRYNIEQTLIPNWVADTHYNIGDKVYHVPTTYECIEENTDATWTSSHWKEYGATSEVALVIGNGIRQDNRSNAFMVDWSGNGHYMGDIYVNANVDSTGGTKVATVDDITVEDVQIDGTSIISDGVAEIPIASASNLGVVKADVYTNGYIGGIATINNKLYVVGSNLEVVKFGGDYSKPLAVGNQHQATFYGLAKAAGHDEKDSTLTVGNYTPEAKGAIQSMLGIDSLIAPTETNPFTDAHAIGDLFIINGALYRAKTAIAVGDVLDDGVNVDGVNVNDVAVKDVQIDGTSILNNGVANIPVASTNNLGVVKTNADYGIGCYPNGILTILSASDAQMKAGTSQSKAITPSREHMAAFYGLAKASGDTTQSQSSNEVGTYTDEAKASIQTMLGVPSVDDVVSDVQINGNSIVSDGVATVPIANSSSLGVIKLNGNYGVVRNSSNIGVINKAVTADTKTGTDEYKPIVPYNQHESTFYGLAKASGDTTQSASSNAVGTYTDEAKSAIQTMLGVPSSDDIVSDVQVNGTSVVTDGVASIPIASTSEYGVVKYSGNGYNGIIDAGGIISINPAYDTDTKAGTHGYKPICPSRQHQAAFYGLAKASGDTTQSASSNAVGTYTDEAKQSIKQMLGVVDSYDSLVVNVTGTDPVIIAQPSYRYNCGEVTTLTITPPSSGTIDFIFTSGTTPTVLDLPSTVKMPSWWIGVEANTTYEMCITDGVYCGVMSWDA